MISFILSILSLSSDYIHNPLHEYKINQTTSIDYLLTYASISGVDSLSNVYENTFNDEFILQRFEGNKTDCEVMCNTLSPCDGYVWHQHEEDWCYLLSNITGTTLTNMTTESYQKIIHHHPPLDEFVISGVAIAPFIDYQNVTLYIDLNLNGILDEGEPFNYTYDDSSFDFYGMPEGSYSIRMIEPHGCRQIYPGYFGYERFYESSGYIDKVVYFTDGGNRDFPGLHGGFVGLDNVGPANFSYILGNSTDTYLSFYDNNSIILTITNDVIVNQEGDDLFFETYGRSSVNANVSVSFNGVNFVHLGELNDNVSSFDLAAVNYDIPVRFVRLHFHCNMTEHVGQMIPRSIRTIYGYDNLTYSPGYAYYTDSDSLFPLFIYDCSNSFSCSTYCFYRVNHTFIDSCVYGCDYFDTYMNCQCNYDGWSFQNFNREECEMGCAYNMEKFVYPNYTIYMNAQGFSRFSIGYSSCDSNCFEEILNDCDNNTECKAFSLEGRELNSFYSFRHQFKNHSFFLAKNSFEGGDRLDYDTTTVTTSQTTSATTSQTTSATTSQTTSATTSQTTSGTSSQTTSATSSQTTSQTTTVTTSQSTTQTTTESLAASTNENNVISSGSIAAIVISTLVLVLIIVGYLIYNHTRQPKEVKTNIRDSYDNPVYRIEQDTPDQESANTFYSDVPAAMDNNYLDVEPPTFDTGYMDVAESSDL